ncbi:MAG: response regulator [Desulfobulbaceae bacterium]|nr:response regulator [Desulfobulbaceae bacterium]
MTKNESQLLTVILVEDDPGHALLIEKNLRRAGIANTIVKLDDGQKAVDFLFKQGEYSGRVQTPPFLILLDLNLPVLSGYQVLQAIKNDERTKAIPVVILTTTDNPHEISRCYELGCNVYIAKPVEYEHFSDAIRKLGLFLSIVRVPDK